MFTNIPVGMSFSRFSKGVQSSSSQPQQLKSLRASTKKFARKVSSSFSIKKKTSASTPTPPQSEPKSEQGTSLPTSESDPVITPETVADTHSSASEVSNSSVHVSETDEARSVIVNNCQTRINELVQQTVDQQALIEELTYASDHQQHRLRESRIKEGLLQEHLLDVKGQKLRIVDENGQVKREIAGLKREKVGLRHELGVLEQDNDELCGRVIELEDTCAQHQEYMRSLENRNRLVEEELTQENQDNEKHEDEIMRLLKLKQVYEDEVASLKAEESKHTNQIDALLKYQQKLEEEAAFKSDLYKAFVATHVQEQSDLRADLEKAEAALTAAQAVRRQDIDILQRFVGVQTAQIIDCKEQYNELKDRHETVVSLQLGSAQECVRNLTQQKADLEHQLEEERIACDHLREANETLKLDLSKSHLKVNALEGEVAEVRNMASILTDSLHLQNAEHDAEIAALKRQLRSSENLNMLIVAQLLEASATTSGSSHSGSDPDILMNRYVEESEVFYSWSSSSAEENTPENDEEEAAHQWVSTIIFSSDGSDADESESESSGVSTIDLSKMSPSEEEEFNAPPRAGFFNSDSEYQNLWDDHIEEDEHEPLNDAEPVSEQDDALRAERVHDFDGQSEFDFERPTEPASRAKTTSFAQWLAMSNVVSLIERRSMICQWVRENGSPIANPRTISARRLEPFKLEGAECDCDEIYQVCIQCQWKELDAQLNAERLEETIKTDYIRQILEEGGWAALVRLWASTNETHLRE